MSVEENYLPERTSAQPFPLMGLPAASAQPEAKNDPPFTFDVQADSIPAALRERVQCIAWRPKWVEGERQKEGHWTKVPVSPRTGGHASVTQPSTWTTFDDALAFARARRLPGIGFVFTSDDPFAGVDLDDCRDPASGAIAPWAQAIIDELDSYTEVSPSGTGVKIFVLGTLPPNARNRKQLEWGEIELYDQESFFTLTGKHLNGTPHSINERRESLLALYARLFPETPGQALPYQQWSTGLTDEAVIAQARAATNGVPFSRLWDDGDVSDYGDDHSRADLALCSALAYWTGPNPEQIDHLFRQSALMRPKWDERRGDTTYGRQTIDRVLQGKTDFYTVTKLKQSYVRRFTPYTARELKLLPRPTYLIDGVFVAESMVAIVAAPAHYKTFLALDWALSVAVGSAWADRDVQRGAVLYITAEGQAGFQNRIEAWERQHGVEISENFHAIIEAVNFLLDADVDALREAIAGLPDKPVLIVVDTLARSMVGGEENSAKDMGAVIAALDTVRREASATILVLHHVNKASGQVRGSTALPGALDTIYELKRERSDLTITCTKMKDGREPDPIYLTAQEVLLSDGASSIVLNPAAGIRSGLSDTALLMLRVLDQTFGEEGATDTQWKEVCQEKNIKKTMYYQSKKELIETFHAIRLTARFYVTDQGKKLLTGGVDTVRTNSGLRAYPETCGSW